MIYVFYNNDPLGNDQGGGAEHFRCIHRALKRAHFEYKLIAAKLNSSGADDHVEYISEGADFVRFFWGLWLWFFRNRDRIEKNDVFHFHRNYAAWPKYVLCRGKGKTIITYHGVTGKIIKSQLGLLSSPVRFIMILFEKMAVSLADTIIFVSDRARQALRKTVLGENYVKTLIIPAAFDSVLFKNALPPGKKLYNKIIIIGRISYEKNIHLAIDVFSYLRDRGHDFSLTIVGDGELREKILSYISHNKHQASIAFLGRIDHKEIPGLIAEHGIVLVTSRFEASPTVVKEAIAAQRPVVTTDVGDVSLWIDNKEYGFICDDTVESLTDGIIKASELILQQRYIRTIDLGEFSEPYIMDQLLEVYKNVENKLVRSVTT